MDLNCAWWNCRLSPPKNGAKKYPVTQSFDTVITELLLRGVDALGLCEVNQENIDHLTGIIETETFRNYRIVNLFRPGKSIDDLCLIYNSNKLDLTTQATPANIRDSLSEKWIKAGIFVGLSPTEGPEIFFGLSHWQSRQTFSENSLERLKLGEALRAKASEILEASPDSPIILLGDYNDEPYHDSIVTGIGASRDANFVRKRLKYFYNPFWSFLSPSQSGPAGTFIHSAIKASHGAVFDQILFSSHFLREWHFSDDASIVFDIELPDPETSWHEVSDHYPISAKVTRLEP